MISFSRSFACLRIALASFGRVHMLWQGCYFWILASFTYCMVSIMLWSRTGSILDSWAKLRVLTFRNSQLLPVFPDLGTLGACPSGCLPAAGCILKLLNFSLELALQTWFYLLFVIVNRRTEGICRKCCELGDWTATDVPQNKHSFIIPDQEELSFTMRCHLSPDPAPYLS